MSIEVTERPAADLAQSVERQIAQRTGRQVQHLAVELVADRLTVHGRVRSYYVKQLAIQACLEALPALGTTQLVVDIDVATGEEPDPRSRWLDS